MKIGADGSSKRSNGRHHGRQASSSNRTGIGDDAQSQQQQSQQQQQQHQQQGLSTHHAGGDSKGREGDGEDVDEVVTQAEADVDRILQGLAAQVQQLVDAAPPNTLLLMTTCQGNTGRMPLASGEEAG